MNHGKNKAKKTRQKKGWGSQLPIGETQKEVPGDEAIKRANQARITKELLDSFSRNMLDKVPKFPLEWDGHEIRRFASDYLTIHYALPGQAWTKQRAAAYREVILNTGDLL